MKIKEISIFDRNYVHVEPGRELGIRVFISDNDLMVSTPQQLKNQILLQVEIELSKLIPDDK
ncbi:MAG TPA: hypothetical protein VFC70_03295 [Oscillospiraceae bacterium]|nr:hypothetical protein [Oscillospiraceae bacterium]